MDFSPHFRVLVRMVRAHFNRWLVVRVRVCVRARVEIGHHRFVLEFRTDFMGSTNA